MDSLLAARAADEGEKTGPQPVAWRWKHQRDERWTYGQQPKHLVPPRGKELIGYYIVEPLFAEPPTPEWTLREQLGRVCEERDALRALLAEAMPELLGELWQESRICSVCFGHNRHSDVCLVARIDDALRSDR
jgi:hypothetical protein